MSTIAQAMALCLAFYNSPTGYCNLTAGGYCAYVWTNPDCVQVESKYYTAPSGLVSIDPTAKLSASQKIKNLLSLVP